MNKIQPEQLLRQLRVLQLQKKELEMPNLENKSEIYIVNIGDKEL